MVTRRFFILAHYAILAVALCFYVYVAFYRVPPFSQAHGPGNNNYLMGYTGVLVTQIYDTVTRQEPLNIKQITWNDHNPALFRFVNTLLARGGADWYELQYFSMGLNTATLLMFYVFVRVFFRSKWTALAVAVYLSFCPVFYAYSTSLDAVTYAAFFTGAACMFYVLYLRRGGWYLMAATLICYFLACWNYWFPWLGAGFILLGIHFAERGSVFSRNTALLAAAPVTAAIVFLAVFATIKGGFFEGLRWLASVAAWRALDYPMPEGYGAWHGPGKFLHLGTLGTYLRMTGERIENWYYLSPAILSIMLAAVLYTYPRERNQAYRIFPFLIMSAFYWHLSMVQHSVNHELVAGYHFPFMAILFGCFVTYVPAYLNEKLGDRPYRRVIAAAVVFPIVFPVASGALAAILPEHEENISRYREHFVLMEDLSQPLEQMTLGERTILASRANDMLKTRRLLPDARYDLELWVATLIQVGDPTLLNDGAGLRNGDFEEWVDGIPLGWKAGKDIRRFVKLEKTDIRSGSRALRLQPGYRAISLTQTVRVAGPSAGKWIRFSVDVKSFQRNTPHAGIILYDGGYMSVSPHPADGAWHTLTVEGRLPNDLVAPSLEVRLDVGGSPSRPVLFDRMSLTIE